MAELDRLVRKVGMAAQDIANARIRQLFVSNPDSALGAQYASAREEGREFAAILGSKWTPLRLMPNRGFTYEIGQTDFAGMGKDALDPEIDLAVTSAVMDAITMTPNIIGAVLQDALTARLPSAVYNMEDRTWLSE
jgi:hypothetical protein